MLTMKIFENDPFAKLDQTGVGKLMKCQSNSAVQLIQTSTLVSSVNTAVTHLQYNSATRLVLTTFHAHHSEYQSQDLLLHRLLLDKQGVLEKSEDLPEIVLSWEFRIDFETAKAFSDVVVILIIPQILFSFTDIYYNIHGGLNAFKSVPPFLLSFPGYCSKIDIQKYFTVFR